MGRGFLFRPSLRPSFRPARRAATVSFGTPASSRQMAPRRLAMRRLSLGLRRDLSETPRQGREDPTNPPSLRGTRGVSSLEIPGRLFVWRRSKHAAWMQKLRMFNKINATAVTVTFIRRKPLAPSFSREGSQRSSASWANRFARRVFAATFRSRSSPSGRSVRA